jgi:hypothetical protein
VLEDDYRYILDTAAATAGEPGAVTEVTLDGWDLTFRHNGQRMSWFVDQTASEFGALDRHAIETQIGELEPRGDDPRRFYFRPAIDPDDHDYYFLLSEAQANALNGEFNLALNPVA